VLRHPGARAVTGGVALAGATALPPRYRGDYVFGDWLKNRIFVVPVRAPRGSTPRLLSHNAGGPVTFAVGPDGALYYLAANLGEVRRISTATE
jgi:glucose/arabinose dehydrogenase